MIRHRLIHALGAVAILATVSCGDGVTPPQPELSLDSLFARMDAAGTYSDAGRSIVGAPMMPLSAGVPSACPYDAASQRFVCPTVSRDGMTADRWYQLLDATGHPLAAFDPATVAAVRTVTHVSGTRTMTGGEVSGGGSLPPMTITHESDADQTLSGLLAATPTLNGTVQGTSTTTTSSYTRSFSMKQTTTNLVLPRARGEYPRSGTISTEMTTSGLLEPMTSTMTMTFNGTSIVTMTFTSGGHTITCQVDLSQPMRVGSCPSLPG